MVDGVFHDDREVVQSFVGGFGYVPKARVVHPDGGVGFKSFDCGAADGVGANEVIVAAVPLCTQRGGLPL